VTKDEIVQMAREAELTIKPPSWGYTEYYHFAGYEDIFFRFAELVAARERDKWIRAIDEEMVSCHLGVFNVEDDPKAAIAKLLAWHQDVALDPAVSSEARELIAKEREACAKVCDERAKGWKDVKLTRNDTYAAMQTAAKNEARALAEALRARGNT
jgi:hypothetical protein